MPRPPEGGEREPAERDARETHAAGMTMRRAVLGDAHVDRAIARTDPFTADFQNLITRYAWGEIWNRDGLDRRIRSCITLAMLATLRCDEEFAMHVRAARRNGVSADEIKEVLLQVAIYAGVPAANTAFAIAQRVLAEDSPNDSPDDSLGDSHDDPHGDSPGDSHDDSPGDSLGDPSDDPTRDARQARPGGH